MGAIDDFQLKAARTHAQQWDMDLGRACVERGFCSADDVLRAYSLQTGYAVVSLDSVALDPHLAEVLPLKVSEQYRTVPLRLLGQRGENIALAMAPPADLAAIDAVLAYTKRRRAVVHIAHDAAIERAIARLYGKETAAPVEAPTIRFVGLENENVFDFGEAEPEAKPKKKLPKPVKLYGWHQASMRALKMMIERGGVLAEPLDDDGLELLEPDDIVITSTLGLRAVLPANQRLPATLIICGTPDEQDAEEAEVLGARVYLRPPFSTEQLVRAVNALQA